MPIGERNIASLFKDDEVVEKQSPRDEVLKLRNKAVCARIYYYLHVKKMRYDVVLEMVCQEFFLAELTVGRIINNNTKELARLKSQKADTKDLRKDWPHLSW